MEKQGRITAVCGNNFKDVNITALQQINPTDLEVENIIILPDRSSLAMEKEIFSTLAINSTMNINIMGISRFAKSIFKNLKAEFEFLSKKESVMLVRIAMKNLKGKLISFKGALDLGLCTEVFEALSQFKSNQIGLDDITEAQKLLPMFSAERLADLKLILEEYDRLLGEKLDSTKMLEVLENYLEKKDFDKTNIFFLNYDALTKQGYSILKALAKTKANIFVGALVPENSPNRFVFENDIFDKLKTLENQGVEISILRAGNTLGVENQHIGKFLFAHKIKECESEKNFYSADEGENKEAEILALAQKINFLLLSGGVSYKNIAVALSNLEADAPLLEKIFNQYGFSYFIDKGILLQNTQPINYLLNICALLEKDFEKETLKQFVFSDLTAIGVQEKNKILDLIEEKNLHGVSVLKNDELKNLLFQNTDFENLIKEKEKCVKIKDFCNFLRLIFEKFDFENNIQKLIEKFQKNNELKLEKIYFQIPRKIEEILVSIENILAEEECLFSDFIEIFKTFLEEVEINAVPLSADAIFVGDATASFFEEIDYLFVVGANEGELPRSLSDTGILNDGILNAIAPKCEITPSVRMINRRNRFKVLNLLILAKKHLFVSYSLADHAGKKLLPSVIVESLNKMFSRGKSLREKYLLLAKNGIDFSSVENFGDYLNNNLLENQLENLSENEKVSQNEILKIKAHALAVKLGNSNSAKQAILKDEFAKTPEGALLYNSLYNALEKQNFNYDFINNYNLNIEPYNLFFPKEKTTVSQIESYLSCPFKNYATYGLKLKEKENYFIEPRDVGNILHKVSEIFLKPERNYIAKIKQIIEIEKNAYLDKNLNKEKFEEKSEKNSEKQGFIQEINVEINKNTKNDEINLDIYLNKIKQKEIENIVKNIFEEIKNYEKFAKLKIKENKDYVLLLEKEATRLCLHLYYSQTVSKFKPELLEEYFGSSNLPAYEFKLENKKIKLVGVVDRVDAYNNMFLVIDYKSGGNAKGNYVEVYYGEKIQIFVYLKVLEEILGKIPCGAFYMPIKNQYEEGAEKNYLLQGLPVDEPQFLNAMDTSLNFTNIKSKIFKAQISVSKANIENGEKKFNGRYTISRAILKNLMDYSMAISKNALKEMLNKNISPCPTQNICSYCKFKALCGYDISTPPRNHTFNIKKDFFENFTIGEK